MLSQNKQRFGRRFQVEAANLLQVANYSQMHFANMKMQFDQNITEMIFIYSRSN